MSAPRNSATAVQRTVVCCLVISAVIFSLAIGYAQPYERKGIYRVNVDGWVQSKIPGAVDVYTCKSCRHPVQIRVIYGSNLSRSNEFQSNKEFLQALSTRDAQRSFARSVMKDLVPKDAPMDILKTKISALGGLQVFLFQSATMVNDALSRKTIMMVVHRKRMVTVALNYFEGGMDESSRDAVRAFYASFRFL